MVALGFAEFGFAYWMSIAPVQTLNDLRSQKAWAPEDNKIALSALQAFDISPITLPLRDVLMGLQTGMINVVAGSPAGALALQWHNKIKYITDLPMVYLFGVLTIDKSAFDEIEANDQKIVRDVMAKAIQDIDQHSRQANQQALAALQNQGIQLLKPSPESADELKQKVATARTEFAKTAELSPDKNAKLQQLLQDLRRNTQP